MATRELPDMILNAVARGDSGIRIPPGRYYVRPENGTHLELEDVSNFRIDATGVEMVCSETTRAIFIKGCEDLTIRGLTIDYDPLPYTQGRIVEISKDRKSHTVQIEKGYPPADSAIVFKHFIYTPEKELRFGHYYRMELAVLEGNRLRISGLHPDKDGKEEIGDMVVISSETLKGRYDPHAIHTYGSKHTVFEDITLYASPCFGFFEEHSSETTYRRCVVDRRDGRFHSLNADGFHSKFAPIGPKIEDCSAMWMGDDGVNICGAYHLVLSSSGEYLRILAKRDLDIKPGDPVELIDVEGRSRFEATVVSIRPDGLRTGDDLARISELPLLPGVVDLLKEAFVIRLDQRSKLETGAVVGALNRMGNGFSITGSSFGNLRSRGILIKARDGEIVGNTVINCHLEGIKISPEYNWLESGTSQNLLVSKNKVVDSGAVSLRIDTIGDAMLQSEIEIVDNEFQSDSRPLVIIRGLEKGRFDRNRLSDASGGTVSDSAVRIENSRKVRR